MKRMLLLLAAAVLSLSSMARGYRGMFDIGAGPEFGSARIRTSTGEFRQSATTFGGLFSTAHGCQIDDRFFAGAGFGITYENTKALGKGAHYAQGSAHLRTNLITVPIFLDFRWNLDINRKITPFADVRIGYQISTVGYVMYKAQSVTNSAYNAVGLMRTMDCMYLQATAGARFKAGSNIGVNVGLSFIPILKREVDIEGPKALNRNLLLLTAGIDFQGSGKSTSKERRKEKLYRMQQENLKKQKEKYDIQ